MKLRIKSLALLLIPILNSVFGVHILNDQVDGFLDALFVIWFGWEQFRGWFRAYWPNVHLGGIL